MLSLGKFPFIVARKAGLELNSDFSKLLIAIGKVSLSLGLGHLTSLFFSSQALRSLAHPLHTFYKLYPNPLKTASLKLMDTDYGMVNLRMLEHGRNP